MFFGGSLKNYYPVDSTIHGSTCRTRTLKIDSLDALPTNVIVGENKDESEAILDRITKVNNFNMELKKNEVAINECRYKSRIRNGHAF